MMVIFILGILGLILFTGGLIVGVIISLMGDTYGDKNSEMICNRCATKKLKKRRVIKKKAL